VLDLAAFVRGVPDRVSSLCSPKGCFALPKQGVVGTTSIDHWIPGYFAINSDSDVVTAFPLPPPRKSPVNQTTTMWTMSILLAAILFISIKVARYSAYTRVRKAHGCEEPRKYPHKDLFLGLDYWRD
jgi:hypothetical protein